ncbi:hypothetical protein IFM89_035191 [Coptis chinensis]|uniref:Uncharacterized protein n=1 Tax=Coptis chinensis TaxID=261450 RepID=A0A835IIV1_9MAGN|nr:hypothetical protein IFM89_035191 [Coptis chinensis]
MAKFKHVLFLLSDHSSKSNHYKDVFNSVGIHLRPIPAPKIKICARGNPGIAGIGVSFRDHEGQLAAQVGEPYVSTPEIFLTSIAVVLMLCLKL